MQELTKLYEHLRQHVPRNVSSLSQMSSNEISEIRKQVILDSRIIVLYPYIMAHKDENICYFADSDAMKTLYKPNDPGAFIGVSQLSQNFGFLMNSLLEDPRAFANAVIGRSNCPDFEHIVRCVIPSCFGFFSCGEQLDAAFHFYLYISQIAEPKLAVRILEPFFMSPATYRMIDYALDRFYKAFIMDFTVTSEENRMSSIPNHGNFLIDCFIKAAPLMPEHHLKILRQLQRRKLKTDVFADLVLVRFLFPSAIRWIASSPCQSQVSFFKKILAGIADQKNLLMDLYKTYLKVGSMFEPLKMYRTFEHSYMTLFLCVNDICLLARMLEEAGSMPKHLSLREFLGISAEYQYSSFWCQHFTKLQDIFSAKLHRLVFPDYQIEKGVEDQNMKRRYNSLVSIAPDNSIEWVIQNSGTGEFHDFALREAVKHYKDMADKFEELMNKDRRKRQLRRWGSLVSDLACKLMESNIDYFCTEKDAPRPSEIDHKILLLTVSGDLVEPVMPKLAECATIFNEHIASTKGEFSVSDICARHPSAKKLIYDSIRALRCTDKVPLYWKYSMLMRALLQIEQIAMIPGVTTDVWCAVIRQLPGSVVIVPFIVFNGTVARVRGFMSEDEKRVWVSYESYILQTISLNPDLMMQVPELADEIEKLFRKRK